MESKALFLLLTLAVVSMLVISTSCAPAEQLSKGKEAGTVDKDIKFLQKFVEGKVKCWLSYSHNNDVL